MDTYLVDLIMDGNLFMGGKVCGDDSSLNYFQGKLPIVFHVSNSFKHMGKALGLDALSNDSIGLCSYLGNSLVFLSTS